LVSCNLIAVGNAVKVLGRKTEVKMYGCMKEEEKWRIRQKSRCRIN
jgi:hypothetical protein